MLVTAPEKSFSSLPQGPTLMPVLELRAGGHAKRECDGAKSDSQPSILGRHDAVLRHGEHLPTRQDDGKMPRFDSLVSHGGGNTRTD